MSSAPVTGPAKPGGPLKIALAYCTCFLLWGSTWSVVKVGLEDLPPLRFVGIRMLVAGLALLPFARARGASLGSRTGWNIAGLGLLQIALPFGLLFVGQQWIPSSWAALLFSTFPMWLLLVGRVMMPEQRLTGRKLLAAGLGVAGVLVLQHSGLGALEVSGRVLLGCLLCLTSVAVISVANVLAKKHMGHVPAHVLVFGQTFSSALPLLALSFLLEAGQPMNWSTRSVLAVLYLALCGTVLTYQCLYWLLPRISLAALGAMALLDTLVAVVLGVVFLDEPLTLSLLLGGALILGGAAIANLIPADERPRPDATATGEANAR
ncbi:EamA family transporter [Pyxidicoccus fallax]|uniref:EamA family transporter n=1 Tax=Pyxidicoccus fallax TaxID=394095 RepID=A0A848LCW6_9BACT|nr:EamA family transporter [Pyxidicoccus fallax]NMO16072.1 EamA family transporter [Pyxidicoccus fallax]NPC81780.1 EamA family transporter [Pyxidicoccus fallax]